MDLRLVVTPEQIAQRRSIADLDALEELEVVVGPAIDDGDADVVVCVVAVAALVELARAGGDDVGRVEARVEGVGLAGVDHEEQLAVAALLPHLREGVGQVPAGDLLAVLELEELVAAVARHVHEHVAARVGAQPLAARHLRRQPVRQQPHEGLHRHFVAPVVHFDVVAVEVQRAVRVVVHRPREGVARVAGHVVRQHEDDLRVGDAETLDGAVEGEHVGQVAVIEPEARGGDEDGPVGGVVRGGGRGGEGGEEEDGEEGQAQQGDGEEMHRY